MMIVTLLLCIALIANLFDSEPLEGITYFSIHTMSDTNALVYLTLPTSKFTIVGTLCHEIVLVQLLSWRYVLTIKSGTSMLVL